MRQAAVSLENISKTFGSFKAVDDLNFHIEKGEIYGFLGPNGAGKTTTLRMMLDILTPTTGNLSILGSPTAGLVRRQIGYLPEERGLYRKMKAAESIAYFAQLRGVPRGDANRRAVELMREFGLEEFTYSRNDALSKGMAQKVQLLSTIAHDPELLILDEPFSGLDPINQQTLEDLIRAQRDAGKTIIFSTHVMQHAERLCDRFLIIAHGQKRFEGNMQEARALFSRRINLRTHATREQILALGGVHAITDVSGNENGNVHDFELELDSADVAQAFLTRAVSNDIPILRFEEAGAALHDIFVALAGDEAVSEANEKVEAA